jgi:predicted enzyme related to lactoylglutathione lyase
MFSAAGVPVAGCMPNQPGTGYPDGWGTYLRTPDARATVDAALAHGGTLREGPLDVADLGTQAVLTDPCGARIGVWQAKAFPGFGQYAGEPGTPAYFELLTRDYDEAVRFYKQVFGWGPQVLSETPQFRLIGLTDGKQTLAGIMDASGFLPAGQSDHWAVYLKVADTDAALATVTRLGGTVTQEPDDTPYGRLAGAADPLGARFKIVG